MILSLALAISLMLLSLLAIAVLNHMGINTETKRASTFLLIGFVLIVHTFIIIILETLLGDKQCFLLPF